MEMRMAAIHGTVDGDYDRLLVHSVKQNGQTGGNQMSRTSGHALADVTHIGTILHGWVVYSKLGQNFDGVL